MNTLILAFTLLFGFGWIGFSVLSTSNPTLLQFSQAEIIVGVAVISLATIILFLALTREVIKTRGYTLMSLVSEYREFVEKVVGRIRKGALGDRPQEDFEVIICIDELDKIIDQVELRSFIRRIKVIFEIPGVYYYLSLSEDALKSFYLGTAEGKNEIDSAFDHIIYVPPVDCDLGEEIARAYLDRHSQDSRHPRLERTIAAVSYGVPRDILRRCDELIAKGNFQRFKPSYVSDNLRIQLVNLAYAEERLTKEDSLNFSCDDANKVLEHVSRFFARDTNQHQAIRIALGIWLLALLSLATDLIEEQWLQVSERLRDIGYRISEDNVQGLIEELNSIQPDILVP